MSSLFSKVAGYRPVTLLKTNPLKGSLKDFANIKSYFFLYFHSLGTASHKEQPLSGCFHFHICRN